MVKRKIIKIDEDKCNGCGQCIPNCPEGALRVIDGKARLISDLFCDGLGACIGNCPQGAIVVEEREAEKYDESRVIPQPREASACACPGSQTMDLRKAQNWPIQIKLVPAFAPYFQGGDLVIAADCTAFSFAGFHQELLSGKILLIGCPKLDDAQAYQEKLSQIFKNNNINSVTCVHMEVPCCFGLVILIKSAITDSEKDIPFSEVTIGIKGGKLK